MKKTLLCKVLAGMLSAAMLLLAGCTAGNTAGVSGDLMAGVRAAGWPDPPEQLDQSFQTAAMNFAWSMFRASAANEGNVLISPASIYLALAMTMNGARGDTFSAMRDALSSGTLTQDEINAACRDWISLLREETEKTKLAVANSIWYRKDYPVAAGFLQTNADFFDAAARALDFGAPEAVNAINSWVKDRTRNTIDKIVDEINPDTVMYLINAVYFKSDWLTPFDANDTGEGDFQTADGAVTVDFMHRSGEMSYVELNGAQGVLLPYENERYAFFAVLPPEGTDVRTYIDGMDGSGIAALLTAMRTGDVGLTLPKFETEYEDSLINELTALGMGIAFTGEADFSGMNGNGVSDLFIAEVLHKTYCRVDELGTEAAAVTSVEMWLTAIMEPETQIVFDRPFVYGIVDTASGAPLFLGVMDNPAR